MSTTTLSKIACAETYNDVEKLICKICWTFIDKFDGDFDEYFSVGNEVYSRAYEKFDSSYGNFSTWIWRCVWNALIDELRKKGRLKVTRLKYHSNLVEQIPDRNRLESDFIRFTCGLSEDAYDIVELVFDTPRDLAELLGITKRSELCGILRDYLHNVGWTMIQITEAFSEIRNFVGR